MKAVIYARFSSSGQREESIEGQIRECRSYAERKGYTVVETYSDRALSGTNDKRPEFQRMIHDSSKHLFQVVICWKHDRFSRNRFDAATYKYKLKNNGVSIEYAAEPLSDGAEAIILDSVLEGYAEYYSANLSQNVKRGLYDSALKRQTLGQNLYGYRKAKDGTYEINPEQAPIVKRIFSEYISGKPTIDILNDLNNEGYRTLYGGKFGKSSVPKIISNPKYKGVYQYADIYDEHGVPEIVSPETWELANEMLKRKGHAPNSNSEYLLTGKLFCGHCGKMMVAGGGKSMTGRYYQYYQCKSKDKKPVPKDFIERLVIDKLVEAVHSNIMVDEFADQFMAWQKSNDPSAEITSVKANLNNISKQIDNIVDAIANGTSTPTLNSKLVDLEEQKVQVENKLSELEYDTPIIDKDAVVWFITQFRDIQDPEWEKYLIRNFLKAVFLFDDGHLIIQLNTYGDSSIIGFDLVNEISSSFKTSSPPKASNSNYCIYGFWIIVTKYPS